MVVSVKNSLKQFCHEGEQRYREETGSGDGGAGRGMECSRS